MSLVCLQLCCDVRSGVKSHSATHFSESHNEQSPNTVRVFNVIIDDVARYSLDSQHTHTHTQPDLYEYMMHFSLLLPVEMGVLCLKGSPAGYY